MHVNTNSDENPSSADTFFCVVDLHAITLPHEPRDLLEATRKSAALYIASGINPDNASIFVQSHVTAHAELAWLLQCYTPIGWAQCPCSSCCLPTDNSCAHEPQEPHSC